MNLFHFQLQLLGSLKAFTEMQNEKTDKHGMLKNFTGATVVTK